MRTVLLALALLVFATAANAQDATVVDPQHYKVMFENDHVRVVKITYGAGESSVMHEHPAHVAIGLTDGSWSMKLPNGETMEISTPAGDAVWAPAGPHLPTNMGDKAAQVIIVELKGVTEMEEVEEDED